MCYISALISCACYPGPSKESVIGQETASAAHETNAGSVDEQGEGSGIYEDFIKRFKCPMPTWATRQPPSAFPVKPASIDRGFKLQKTDASPSQGLPSNQACLFSKPSLGHYKLEKDRIFYLKAYRWRQESSKVFSACTYVDEECTVIHYSHCKMPERCRMYVFIQALRETVSC